MQGKLRIVTVFLTISYLIFIIVVFTQCSRTVNAAPDSRGEAYANAATCIKCHQNIYNSYVHTSHYKTSAPVNMGIVRKLTDSSAHAFQLNDSVQIKVTKQPNGLYQTAYVQNKPVRSQRFDIAFGSGKEAQTYGYWKGNQLFQLPLSYFSQVHTWANSPGFPASHAYYDRAIITRCFECHASYLEKDFVQNGSLSVAQEYKKNSIVYGIDCQRCHGPSAQHVDFHLANPDEKNARYIATYQSLSRQQKVDMCAVCHSGSNQELQKSTFAFKPGDTLRNYYYPFGQLTSAPDVHGNQSNLLSMSKCYISSDMTCTSCHNTHAAESGNLVTYAQKCMNCHKAETHNVCKMAPQLGSAINEKCIDCHMPAMPSKLITYRTSAAAKTSSYYLRTHQIAIYPQQVKKILAYLKSNNLGQVQHLKVPEKENIKNAQLK